MATRGNYTNSNLSFLDNVYSPAKGTSLWERAPTLPALCDPRTAVFYYDDFIDKTVGTNTIPGWTFTNVTTGTVTTDTTNPNGVTILSAGAATAHQGVNWQLNVSPFKVAASKPVFFEARVQFTGLTNLRVETFIGLAATSTAIIATGAMAALDRIGFQGITTTGVLTSVNRGGGTAVTGTGLTLVNSTWYTLGMVCQTTGVDFYVNGSLVSTLTTQVPTGVLAPSFVCQANGTDTPVMNCDYVQVIGVRN